MINQSVGLMFEVKRITKDDECIFIKGETYRFVMTKSDFIFRGQVWIEGGFLFGGIIGTDGAYNVDSFNADFERVSQGEIVHTDRKGCITANKNEEWGFNHE